MKKLGKETDHCHLLGNSVQPDKVGLLKTGVLPILLHIVLAIFFILNLKSTIPKGRSKVYWVNIRPGPSIALPPNTKGSSTVFLTGY